MLNYVHDAFFKNLLTSNLFFDEHVAETNLFKCNINIICLVVLGVKKKCEKVGWGLIFHLKFFRFNIEIQTNIRQINDLHDLFG